MKKRKNGSSAFFNRTDFLISEIFKLLLKVRKQKIKLVFIGGVAVRYYLKKTERITKDIDVVVATKQLDEFRKLLESESYKVGNFDPWFRAIKEFRGNKIILDFTGENVVELNNYNSLKINFNSFVRKKVELGEGSFYIPLPKLEVLILLKLLSRREKDTIDVILILLEKFEEINLPNIRKKFNSKI